MRTPAGPPPQVIQSLITLGGAPLGTSAATSLCPHPWNRMRTITNSSSLEREGFSTTDGDDLATDEACVVRGHKDDS